MPLRAIAVYCGSSLGVDDRHSDSAALNNGGRVTGVITQSLLYAEVGHRSVTELITVETMHERKMLMNERADAFVMLPGGYGTLDER